ncbi:MAG: sigma-70 family RNA polymerase sigma factor [Chloroflexi bacterium]|nr:sigma-70 family RNA polymerase sigma factor [Chloroflexota bacterium]
MRSVSVPEEWVAQARAGDRQAFTLLVEAYQVPVYNLCRRMLGNPGEAEDAAQETFWRAFQALEGYDPQRPFATWLLSIAAHHCIDYLRRQRLVALSLEAMPDYHDTPDSAPGPESSAEAHERERRVAHMLQMLDPLDRAAIVMRYWYDLSYEEMGEALSLSVSAVKSRLHRARRQLAGVWPESPAGGLARGGTHDAAPAV